MLAFDSALVGAISPSPSFSHPSLFPESSTSTSFSPAIIHVKLLEVFSSPLSPPTYSTNPAITPPDLPFLGHITPTVFALTALCLTNLFNFPRGSPVSRAVEIGGLVNSAAVPLLGRQLVEYKYALDSLNVFRPDITGIVDPVHSLGNKRCPVLTQQIDDVGSRREALFDGDPGRSISWADSNTARTDWSEFMRARSSPHIRKDDTGTPHFISEQTLIGGSI